MNASSRCCASAPGAAFVRRIHGDLHLGNIVLIDGKPVLFDAIEFSDIIASGDVFYDLAFLLMDLLERDLAPAANTVLNRYLAETRRVEDLEAWRCCRSSCRCAPRSAPRSPPCGWSGRLQPTHAAIARAARAYFDSRGRAITPPEPKFVAIGGLSGTGKCKLARALASGNPADARGGHRALGRRAQSAVRRRRTEKLPAAAYSEEVTAKRLCRTHRQGRRIVAAGHSVIIDAVFAKPEERAAIAQAAKLAQLPLRGLFLTADMETRLGRVGRRLHDASDADAAMAQAQERYHLGPLDWLPIDASGTPKQPWPGQRRRCNVLD